VEKRSVNTGETQRSETRQRMQRITAPCNNQPKPKEKMQREKEDLKKLRLDPVSLRNGSPVPLYPTCLAIV
jgi:hypothetical protein